MIITILLFIISSIIIALFLRFLFLYFGNQDISSNLRKFSYSTPIYSERFPLILKSFLSGSNATLAFILDMKKLRKYLECKFPSYYKGFAYEGAGMGFGIRASLSTNKAKAFEKYITKLSPLHKYQFYVGLGWWLLIRYGFQESKYEKWFEKLNAKYCLIALDGVGFRTGLYSLKNDNESFQQFEHLKTEYQRVCFQGFGRSIWFQSEFQIEESLKRIEFVPEKYKEDALSGLGLAVAYSFFDQLSKSFSIYNSLPMGYKSSFAQGMAFGLEARKLQDPIYWKKIIKELPELNKEYIHPWVQIVHKIENELSSHKVDSLFYLKWMDGVRKEVYKKGENHEKSTK
ncbi:DUF1702 family protein [Bacillus sp. 166amftsu]|uniref:DUF1702 family protein n=1 Tax=Bacillus sp. 166amftsu TaxID=1761753 RepID=UPI00089BADFF|nr:DUF1702 family protein [Bacillus sp. 166amftsu]SDZ40520.1 Protein of unknown function [Bacillus sp. 166amftsu]